MMMIMMMMMVRERAGTHYGDDDDDDDVDGDDEHGTQAMQATPTGQLSYCIFHPQGPTIRRLLVAQLITFVILVFFAQALLSGSQ